MKKHKMYYMDKFNRKVFYESHSYKELKEFMLELSKTEGVGDIYYIDPKNLLEKVLCYYND